jgi:pilus assembly protein CpaC
MVKAAISAAAMAALQVLAAERALTIDRRVAEMRVVSSDATANQLKLGFKKAVVIDLSADIKDVLVADPGTAKVILRTTRRVYIIGAALGKTNIFFFDDDGRQIVALDVWVSEIVEPQPSEHGESFRRQQRDPISRHFLNGLRLRD